MNTVPIQLTAWTKSAEGKAWAQANPGAKFPPAAGKVKKAAAKGAAKVGKVAKKAKPIRKPAKKAKAKVAA